MHLAEVSMANRTLSMCQLRKPVAEQYSGNHVQSIFVRLDTGNTK